MPLGYSIDLYDDQPAGGGFMRSQIPAFRLPEGVLNQEVNYILDMGVITQFNTYVDSLKSIIDKNYDAVLFAQRSWQTRQVERNLNHPD